MGIGFTSSAVYFSQNIKKYDFQPESFIIFKGQFSSGQTAVSRSSILGRGEMFSWI
ncbi:hypothetical protein DCCM_2096 [Desulfocucumis palustris]|uniref:Uncharacterized protein n=1 Tax=Desulfocucumis palustris TaxID=1898651 RepID=A0A2L2X9S4_9FIRM|nr:hypothetical protein DCCM_2096 [Desulfocucumis palustris]